jgi:alkanesulfonate monooxygenase SsuD/methylene tetrahydromethanopterin reductase-like flavin-dependent oxidoreductase (luciferase family)
MTRRLCIDMNWQYGLEERRRYLDQAVIAEDAGVDTIFVAEAWGRDAFTTLALLADRTKKANLGTAIVNYYSRTPAALAQHFATLDELSGGRMVIGLGASSANVIEHFHGVPFNPTLARMRETVEIINHLMADQPLHYHGKVFDLDRGFTLRFDPVRPHIPVYIASFRPRALKVVAEVADGWLPRMIPIDRLPDQVAAFRGMVTAAGREANAVTVIAPGRVAVVKDVEKQRQSARETLAFYIARMGDFYYEQLSDMGYDEDCNAIRAAWKSGGSHAGYAAVSDRLLDSVWCITSSVEEARERLQQQDDGGVDMHSVLVRDTESDVELGRVFEALLK